ncbi:MAG: branched-chain amino acid ABC transporter permease [Bacteroidetes bacterium]|nr:branched-chain amino acid ABC transporter permease [Bacteroidota bacterium]
MFLQFIINGLITGMLYTLASLGYALVYNTTRIFHLALAVLYVVAAYIFWHVTVVCGFPMFAGIFASVCFTALLSLAIDRLVYFPLFKLKASLSVVLVSSIGVFTVLTNLVALTWGNEFKAFGSDISRIYSSGNLIVTGKQLFQFIASLVLIITFFLFLNRSKTGLRIKAVRDDSELYQVLGFSLTKMRVTVFLLSGAMISLASCLTAWDIGMDPYVGMPILLNAIVALIIGGAGRFESCVIGGITLGILQALVVWQWSAQWQEAITFVVLIIFLFLRPQGFIGEKSRVV